MHTVKYFISVLYLMFVHVASVGAQNIPDDYQLFHTFEMPEAQKFSGPWEILIDSSGSYFFISYHGKPQNLYTYDMRTWKLLHVIKIQQPLLDLSFVDIKTNALFLFMDEKRYSVVNLNTFELTTYKVKTNALPARFFLNKYDDPVFEYYDNNVCITRKKNYLFRFDPDTVEVFLRK